MIVYNYNVEGHGAREAWDHGGMEGIEGIEGMGLALTSARSALMSWSSVSALPSSEVTCPRSFFCSFSRTCTHTAQASQHYALRETFRRGGSLTAVRAFAAWDLDL